MSFLDKEKFDRLTRQGTEGFGKTPPPGQKKDTSALGGKSFLPFGKFATRVEKDPSWNIFEKTKLGKAKRKDLANKFYLKEIMGPNIDSSDIRRGKQELALGSQGKYRKLPPTIRKNLKKIIDAFPESKI